MTRVESFAALASQVRARPARCGQVRVVAVDGPAGSGKSSFAGRLARAAGGAPVLSTDDLLDGWDDLPGYWDRLQAGVLEPLSMSQPGRYRRYDWVKGSFAEEHTVPVCPLLVVEGVAAATACAGFSAFVAWVEAPRGLRLARGVARDGEALRAEWTAWMAREDAHFAAAGGSERADVVVDGAPSLPHDAELSYVAIAARGANGLGDAYGGSHR